MALAAIARTTEWPQSLVEAAAQKTSNSIEDASARAAMDQAVRRSTEATEFGVFFAENWEKIFTYHARCLDLIWNEVGEDSDARRIFAGKPVDVLLVSDEQGSCLVKLNGWEGWIENQPLGRREMDDILLAAITKASRMFTRFLAICDLDSLKRLVKDSPDDQRIEIVPSETAESRVRHAVECVSPSGEKLRNYHT